MSNITLAKAKELSGTEFYAYLDAQAEVPTVTKAACRATCRSCASRRRLQPS